MCHKPKGQQQPKDSVNPDDGIARGFASEIIKAYAGQDEPGHDGLNSKARGAVDFERPTVANVLAEQVSK